MSSLLLAGHADKVSLYCTPDRFFADQKTNSWAIEFVFVGGVDLAPIFDLEAILERSVGNSDLFVGGHDCPHVLGVAFVVL
jgi:hypothetical protein